MWAFQFELSLWSLDSAKHHPFVTLSYIPTSSPKHPRFSDQKKRPTCIPLFTGNLLTSTKLDKGESQPFLWNTTGDTKVSEMGKKTSAEIEHWNITTYIPWKASLLTEPECWELEDPLTSLHGNFFLFTVSSFSHTALKSCLLSQSIWVLSYSKRLGGKFA